MDSMLITVLWLVALAIGDIACWWVYAHPGRQYSLGFQCLPGSGYWLAYRYLS